MIDKYYYRKYYKKNRERILRNVIKRRVAKYISLGLEPYQKSGIKKGTKLSDATKKKMSETHKRIGTGKWMKGRHPTNKARENMSIAQMKRRENGTWKNQHGGYKGGYENRLMLNRQRRAKRMNAEGSHTLEQWEALKKKYNYMCLCCKRYEPEIKLTEDHIISLDKGGSDYIKNIQPLCKSCNSRKHTSIINFTSFFGEKIAEGIKI